MWMRFADKERSIEMAKALSNRRQYWPTLGHAIIVLLAAECMVWVAERFSLFHHNWQKGWPALIALGIAGLVLPLLLLLSAASLFAHRPFQFTVRSLLALAAVTAMPCSWVAIRIQEAKTQAARSAKQ